MPQGNKQCDWYKWSERTDLLKLLRNKKLTQEEVFLLNKFVVGDAPKSQWDYWKAFPRLYDLVADANMLGSLSDHPVFKTFCDYADQYGAYSPGGSYLWTSASKRTAPIVITSTGHLVLRGPKPGAFTQTDAGGGKRGKSLMHCYVSCREGIELSLIHI